MKRRHKSFVVIPGLVPGIQAINICTGFLLLLLTSCTTTEQYAGTYFKRQASTPGLESYEAFNAHNKLASETRLMLAPASEIFRYRECVLLRNQFFAAAQDAPKASAIGDMAKTIEDAFQTDDVVFWEVCKMQGQSELGRQFLQVQRRYTGQRF